MIRLLLFFSLCLTAYGQVTNYVTPAEYLSGLSKPVFKPGHSLPMFSYLEDYIWNGSLLDGDGVHIKSLDQPSYEFTNTVADVTARVLARYRSASNDWLICSWAADGDTRNVTVNIPTLGNVTVSATASANIYRATTNSLKRLNELWQPYPTKLRARITP